MKKEDIDYSVYLVTDRRNKTDEEFPGGPVVRILSFQGQEPGFSLWLGD